VSTGLGENFSPPKIDQASIGDSSAKPCVFLGAFVPFFPRGGKLKLAEALATQRVDFAQPAEFLAASNLRFA
jgi:hypothetical protein